VRARLLIAAVDSHTEGMPTRVVTGGVGAIPGSSMLERRAYFEANMDELRLLLMREPRGHAAMSGAILQPSTRPDADWAVLYIEVSGCLAMCGHGTIGVATVLVETGMVEVREPTTTIRLDTPAGLVTAEVEVRAGRACSVAIENVPAFLHERDGRIDVPGIGEVRYDMAYGGNFYALAQADQVQLRIEPGNAPALLDAGMRILAALAAAGSPVHPAEPAIAGCKHVVLIDPGGRDEDARTATVIHPGWIDRSPCGTGTSARLAQLHARGELAVGQPYVNASLIGTRFTGTVVRETEVAGKPAVVPRIEGRAWITGMGQYVLDPDDPFPAGFAIPAR
jgi:proline racemase